MKKKICALSLLIILLFSTAGCKLFGYEKYENLEDYNKILNLSEIRWSVFGFHIFPKTVDNLNVKRLYCEWDLSMVGSATAEIQLTVEYLPEDYYNEITRLCSLDFTPIYDNEQFTHPAYIFCLGHDQTNWYVVIDKENYTINYCLLQLIATTEIDIDNSLIPKYYQSFGDNSNTRFCAFAV